jgi:hypothetical protein
VETVKVLVEVGADTEVLMTVDGMETKITALQLAAFVRASWTRYASYHSAAPTSTLPPMMMLGTRRCT